MAGEANIWNPRTLIQIQGNEKSVSEVIVATAGQVFFTLSEFQYVINSGALEVHKNGLLLTKGVDWNEVSATSFNIFSGVSAGDVIVATASVGVTVLQEEQVVISEATEVLSAGQTVVTFGDNLLEAALYLNGDDVDNGRLDPNLDYSIDSTGKIVTLAQSYPAGARLTATFKQAGGLSQSNLIQVFSNKSELVASPLTAGQYVRTKGLSVAGDGGHGDYLVKTAAQASADGDVIDEVVNLTIYNGNVAVYQEPNVAGNPNKVDRVFAGVLRRDTGTTEPNVVNANNWFWIDNSGHAPVNIDYSQGDNAGTTQGGVELTAGGVDLGIYHASGDIASVIAGPDETFAKKGVLIGASGGGGFSVLSMSAPCYFKCDMSALTITELDESLWGPIAGNARFSIAKSSSGLITVGHPGVVDNSVHQVRITYKPAVSTGHKFIPTYISTGGSTSTTCFLLGQAEGVVSYDGVSTFAFSSLESWDAADCSAVWDGVNGVLTVTHPTLAADTASACSVVHNVLSATNPVLVCSVFDQSLTGFKVKVRTMADAVPTLSTNVSFLFNRGMSALVDDSKITGELYVEINRAQLRADQMDSAAANIWVLGVVEAE